MCLTRNWRVIYRRPSFLVQLVCCSTLKVHESFTRCLEPLGIHTTTNHEANAFWMRWALGTVFSSSPMHQFTDVVRSLNLLIKVPRVSSLPSSEELRIQGQCQVFWSSDIRLTFIWSVCTTYLEASVIAKTLCICPDSLLNRDGGGRHPTVA